MGSLRSAVLLAVVIFSASAWQPAAVSACTGRSVTFEDAARASHGAVYAGQITRADIADQFWISLQIDIDRVLTGPAASRVPRAQAGSVCDRIQVGQYGIVVRGVREPVSDSPDLFFAMTRPEAQAAFRALTAPNTSTGPPAPAANDTNGGWLWLVVWAVMTLGFAMRSEHRG